MVALGLRAKVVDEARRDAAAFFREFQHAVGPDRVDLDWVAQAWTDIVNDFHVKRSVAPRLWEAYWTTFSEETARLASEKAGAIPPSWHQAS
jgi:hypothetical protein